MRGRGWCLVFRNPPGVRRGAPHGGPGGVWPLTRTGPSRHISRGRTRSPAVLSFGPSQRVRSGQGTAPWRKPLPAWRANNEISGASASDNGSCWLHSLGGGMVYLAGDAEPSATISAPSSRGLGRRPLKAVTPVRIRSGLQVAEGPAGFRWPGIPGVGPGWTVGTGCATGPGSGPEYLSAMDITSFTYHHAWLYA